MIIKIASNNIRKNPNFYLPFFLLYILISFIFTTLLALSVGSSQIYKRSGSEELLAVFESSRACVMASLVPENFKSRIEGLPHIKDITGEVRHIIVYAPKKSLTIAGVESNKFRRFKNIDISEAEYDNFAKDPHGVIIGKNVQKMFKWKVGEAVTLQRMNFTVRGVFELPLSVYNGMIVFHKQYMQRLVKKEGYFTAITIKIDSAKNKGEVSKTVEQLFTDHPAGISCKSETEFWGMTEKQMGEFGHNMRALAVICALLLIALIINVAVFRLKNRHTEIRILSMAGFTRVKMFSLLFFEPVIAALISGICGSCLAFLVWIKQPTIGGEHAIIPPIVVTPTIVIASTFLIFLFSLLSTFPAAYKASSKMMSK